MPHSKNAVYGDQAGFTLIELLLALVMFAIISGVIFASFAAVIKGVEQGRSSGDFYRVGRMALQRMMQEIGAAMWYDTDPRTVLLGEDSRSDEQPRDRITFVTIPYRRFPASQLANELCDVSYYIAENTQGNPALFRSEDCTLDEERHGDGTTLELTDMAVGLDITYYDATETHESWPPNGEEEGPLPCRVHIALILRRTAQDERAFSTTVVLPMRSLCEDKEDQS